MSDPVQLFILPYAGGSAAAFRRMTDLLDDAVRPVTVEYPGRGTRAKEPFAGSMDELLEDVVRCCRAKREEGVPYAVMGYSMGSLLAYEMLAAKALDGPPRHLFICAEVSPRDRALELRKPRGLTDEQLLARAARLGGLDGRMLANPRFSSIYIRPMLADYRLFFQYRFRGSAEKIRTDATFIYCAEDTAPEHVRKWEELIDGVCDYHEMGENHFFINRHYGEMAAVINAALCPEARECV